jgi:hypothetical protein
LAGSGEDRWCRSSGWKIGKAIASVEHKRAVIRRMTEVLVEEPGRDPEHV